MSAEKNTHRSFGIQEFLAKELLYHYSSMAHT